MRGRYGILLKKIPSGGHGHGTQGKLDAAGVRGVPFNGTGHSGMGAYHGEWGFREFTHPSTVLIGSNHLNLPLREHPFTGRGRWKRAVIDRILR